MSFPTTPGFTSFTVKSNTPVFVSRSDSAKVQSRKYGGHLWELKVTFPIMIQEEFSDIDAFIGTRSNYTEFDIISPIINQGTWMDLADGATTVAVESAVGSQSIRVAGLTVGKTVKAGDIFTVGANTKVYKINNTITSASATDQTISFFPPLINTATVGSSIIHLAPAYTVTLVDIHEFKAGPAKSYQYTLDLIESI